MGLAAPKRRTTIAKDPNNTKWANDTSRFGQRVLKKHGWTPGGTLGASDSSHAQHFTAASHSHVRVVIKENTRGLGAKIGSDKPENFGLAGLESILGRLNGREEEVKQEQDRLEGLRRKAAIGQKYGFMNFVSAGFLVGDRVVPKSEFKDEMVIKEEIKEEEGVTAPSEGEERKKKRKRVKVEDDEDVKPEDEEEQPKLKRKKKSMDLRAEMAEQELSKSKKERRDKKDKKKSKKSSSSEPDGTSTSATPIPASAPVEPVSDKARRKAEKRAHKEEKKLKKALKKAARKAAKANADESSSSDEETETTASSSAPATGASTPLTSAGLTFGAGGRHAVRQRYIRQKKMAGMDPQALREIFMIKT
ncbi:hypothetical protein P154DRAFT_549770 [Amniculicola lignicola CBS 123094]|uniref:PinX1-related protein 1 n=1 Tax=Amniculicola lignicola CBS 123094 TaxID=1392246 RepID=A0A6A5VWM0_9PLEO|nr:hypothetical protein P154DRAFT_549770 [Amniculicola lignicola CBS 123094]